MRANTLADELATAADSADVERVTTLAAELEGRPYRAMAERLAALRQEIDELTRQREDLKPEIDAADVAVQAARTAAEEAKRAYFAAARHNTGLRGKATALREQIARDRIELDSLTAQLQHRAGLLAHAPIRSLWTKGGAG